MRVEMLDICVLILIVLAAFSLGAYWRTAANLEQERKEKANWYREAIYWRTEARQTQIAQIESLNRRLDAMTRGRAA